MLLSYEIAPKKSITRPNAITGPGTEREKAPSYQHSRGGPPCPPAPHESQTPAIAAGNHSQIQHPDHKRPAPPRRAGPPCPPAPHKSQTPAIAAGNHSRIQRPDHKRPAPCESQTHATPQDTNSPPPSQSTLSKPKGHARLPTPDNHPKTHNRITGRNMRILFLPNSKFSCPHRSPLKRLLM